MVPRSPAGPLSLCPGSQLRAPPVSSSHNVDFSGQGEEDEDEEELSLDEDSLDAEHTKDAVPPGQSQPAGQS